MTDTPDNALSVVTDSTSDTPDSLSLAEAAARLGVSERTVLRRIDKGILQAYKVDAERGQVWRVRRSATPVTPAPVMSDTTDNHAGVADMLPATQAPELMKVLDILDDERRRVDQLQQANQALWKTLEHWQARCRGYHLHPLVTLDAAICPGG